MLTAVESCDGAAGLSQPCNVWWLPGPELHLLSPPPRTAVLLTLLSSQEAWQLTPVTAALERQGQENCLRSKPLLG